MIIKNNLSLINCGNLNIKYKFNKLFNMSFIKSNINFTPIHPKQINQLDNSLILSQTQNNFNNRLNTYSNYNFNASKIISNYQDLSSNNNNLKNNYYPNDYGNDFDEIKEFNSCYILIIGLDEYSKDTFLNFIENQRISTRDIKIFDKYKIIIKFLDERARNNFMNEFNKVKQDFIGVEITYINEEENNRLININANKISHRTSYYNNYMNNNSKMIQLPKKKSNFQKFLDVFLNL